MELCLNPDIQEKLYQEIKDIRFSNDTNPLELIQKMEYLDWILKESQRLHPVVGSVSRSSVGEVNVCDYQFPPGTAFSVYIRAIHLDPNNYEDPFTFSPERWSKPAKSNTFLPFGDGIHNCIGQKMAVIEVKVFLI
jgi:cytochrome P450